MLSTAWLRRLSPRARRLRVYGDSDSARHIAGGAAASGMRVSSHALSWLRSGNDEDADGIVIDAGDDKATLAEAAKIAPRLAGATIGVVVESWAGYTAALALDAGLGMNGARLRPLSISERRTRATLAAHPWWRLRHAGRPSSVVIFGTGALAEHLVIALFRAMHLPGQSPSIVVVGADAPGWVAALQAAMPQLAETGSLVGARRAPGLEGACVLYATQNDPGLAGFPAAVPLVWLGDGAAPPRALAAPPPDWRHLAQSLFQDREDRRAEAIHSFYFESALRDGNLPGSRPSMLPWAQLPERFRQASRYQADHVPAKLAAIGCREVSEMDRWRFRFVGGEVDALARAEHERWSAVQRLDGWTYGAVRDDAARLTPFLKPYDELAPEIQDRDRMPVRQIPAQLARIGHGVQRDMMVTLSAEAGEPGLSFAFLFRLLLADIAARYPGRSLVLATRLASALERRAAGMALSRGWTLTAMLPPDLVAPPDAGALLARAEHLLAAGGDDAARGGLHLHIGANPPAAARLVQLETDGRVRAAPWL